MENIYWPLVDSFWINEINRARLVEIVYEKCQKRSGDLTEHPQVRHYIFGCRTGLDCVRASSVSISDGWAPKYGNCAKRPNKPSQV